MYKIVAQTPQIMLKVISFKNRSNIRGRYPLNRYGSMINQAILTSFLDLLVVLTYAHYKNEQENEFFRGQIPRFFVPDEYISQLFFLVSGLQNHLPEVDSKQKQVQKNHHNPPGYEDCRYFQGNIVPAAFAQPTYPASTFSAITILQIADPFQTIIR